MIFDVIREKFVMAEIRDDAWEALVEFMRKDYNSWRAAYRAQRLEKQKRTTKSQAQHREDLEKEGKRAKKVPSIYEPPKFAQIKVSHCACVG